jgi:hypothetical protein
MARKNERQGKGEVRQNANKEGQGESKAKFKARPKQSKGIQNRWQGNVKEGDSKVRARQRKTTG